MVRARKRVRGPQGPVAASVTPQAPGSPASTPSPDAAVESVSQPHVVLQAAHAGAWVAADELRRRALESLERCRSADGGAAAAVLHVETAGVESLDAATLQILLALTDRQTQRGGSVALLRVSPPVEACLRTVGATCCSVVEGGAHG